MKIEAVTDDHRVAQHHPPGLGILSLAGHLGPEEVARFTGAIGWVLARGAGPVILDLTALRGWSVGGRPAVTQE
ncbi:MULTISPECIES: hypothetical protein [unclassified Streptomyces]|uniref:hypothetical protein n=1 Tax=unclassified Streptomyces TaxID=2593676 RepID=UPI00380181F3